MDARRDIHQIVAMDDDLLARVNAAFPDEPWQRDPADAFLRDRGNLLLLAFVNDEVAGVLTAHRLARLDDRRAEVLLYAIDVAEPFRRQGIGRALVQRTIAWAAEVGADVVWVLSDGGDDRAIAFYQSTGGVADPPGINLFSYAVPAPSG